MITLAKENKLHKYFSLPTWLLFLFAVFFTGRDCPEHLQYVNLEKWHYSGTDLLHIFNFVFWKLLFFLIALSIIFFVMR